MVEQPVRQEVLRGLIILAIHDDQFRHGAVSDLEGTLRRYGYIDGLNQQEMQSVTDYHSEVADMSDEDLSQRLNDDLPLTDDLEGPVLER